MKRILAAAAMATAFTGIAAPAASAATEHATAERLVGYYQSQREAEFVCVMGQLAGAWTKCWYYHYPSGRIALYVE